MKFGELQRVGDQREGTGDWGMVEAMTAKDGERGKREMADIVGGSMRMVRVKVWLNAEDARLGECVSWFSVSARVSENQGREARD